MKVSYARRKLSAALAATVIASAVAGCAADGASDGEEVTTIRYQSSSGGTIDVGELADALGYLDDLKLKRVGETQGGPESLQALATDQVDYGGAFNGAIAKVTSSGVPITAVISYYGTSGDVDSALVTLEGSDIDEPRDLIGKKVGMNTLGANSEAVLDTYLTEGGLSQDEIAKVTLVPLPSLNIESALREGQIDAARMNTLSQQVALEHGPLDTVFTDSGLIGPYNGGSYALRDDFIEDNPTTTKKFVAGIAKALEYSQTEPVEKTIGVMKDYYEKTGRGDLVDALDHWKGTGVATKGGIIHDQDFDLWLDWLENEGEVEVDAIKADEIYTNEFNPTVEEK